MAATAEALDGLCYGCGRLSQVALDEPVFILRAQDIRVPRVVARRAHLAEQARSPQEKVRGALQLAKRMADWQANNRHRVKVPD